MLIINYSEGMKLLYMKNTITTTIQFLSISLLLLIGNKVQAQGLHFSQNAMAPLITNPAYTGLFGGDVRVGGIYRSQWATTGTQGYKTTSVSADAKLIQGFSDGDWISGGITFYNDKAGTVSLANNTVLLTGGYNLNLFGQGKNYISIGAQFGINQQKIDLSDAQFDSQFIDGVYNSNLSSFENINDNSFIAPIFSVGGMFYNVQSMRNYFFGGASLGQFSGVRKSRLADTERNIVPLRLSLQGGMSKKITETIDIIPRIFIFNEGTSTKADLLFGGRYVFLENKRQQILNAFQVSAGIRINRNNASDTGISNTDALILQAGLEVERIIASLAYDANISDLKVATNGNGAVEFAISYNIGYRNNKYKKTGGSVNCPRF